MPTGSPVFLGASEAEAPLPPMERALADASRTLSGSRAVEGTDLGHAWLAILRRVESEA